MKIRGDFVTNSSSYSSVVVLIQSKELAALLTECQQMFYKSIHISPDRLLVDKDEVATEWGDVPQSLEQLLDRLLDALKQNVKREFQNGPLFGQLKRAFKNRRQELTDSIQKVNWDFQDESAGEFENDGRKIFTYDQQEGGKGNYQQMPWEMSDDDYDFDEEYDEEEEE